MRVPLSWLADVAGLTAEVGTTAGSEREVSERLTALGLTVERILRSEVTGPLVVGVVRRIEELTGYKKPIRFCQVDVGEPTPRGIVCGASNFAVGDRVPVALPGAALPGGFAIGARHTYGHVSDGMICSSHELGIGEDRAGILVLGPGAPVGADAITLLRLDEVVLDIEVTPDRGYAESIRGIARDLAAVSRTRLRDPADLPDPVAVQGGPAVHLEDPIGCPRYATLLLTGLDPTAPAPMWLRTRLTQCGVRSISLAVDVTNYVMLEVGQPMHAYDADRIDGGIVVRRAVAGEQVKTLDGTARDLGPADLVIVDEAGPIGIAGVMGGASTEVSAGSTAILLEAACWEPASIGRTARRQKLPSEAAKRFARGVDPAAGTPALARAAALLTEYGGATVRCGRVVDRVVPAASIGLDPTLPGRIAGVTYAATDVVGWLCAIGCSVVPGAPLQVTPPSWRPDLVDPADLVEEVCRLAGYERIPARLPAAPPGRGLTAAQRAVRAVGTALAVSGYTEVLTSPFLGAAALAALDRPPDDPRRQVTRLRNPISDAEPLMRTTLLPGLAATARRNLGRGFTDLALFEVGAVFLPGGPLPPTPKLAVDHAPSEAEQAALQAALPDQPRHVGVLLTGARVPAGPLGPGRGADWSDAVAAARLVAHAVGTEVAVSAGTQAPWHPGRCAQLRRGDVVVGYAGELHPRVVAALELPARTCAMELDLDALGLPGGAVQAAGISAYPAAGLDVALVVDAGTPAGEVEAALRDGAGELLESVRLFDAYAGEPIAAGCKSLAFALRLRATDRTLTTAEATRVRDAAVAEAARRVGARLRG